MAIFTITWGWWGRRWWWRWDSIFHTHPFSFSFLTDSISRRKLAGVELLANFVEGKCAARGCSCLVNPVLHPRRLLRRIAGHHHKFGRLRYFTGLALDLNGWSIIGFWESDFLFGKFFSQVDKLLQAVSFLVAKEKFNLVLI